MKTFLGLALLALVMVVATYSYSPSNEDLVKATSYDKCHNGQIGIAIRNDSNKTLLRTEFTVYAKVVGHSTRYPITGYDHASTDKILAPKESVAICITPDGSLTPHNEPLEFETEIYETVFSNT